MQIQPSRSPRLEPTKAQNSGSTPQLEAEGPDYLVLVYSANNVASLGSNPQPVAGSYRLIPELKALAGESNHSKVAVVAQGYERLETGKWETRRYEIAQGHCLDQTSNLKGLISNYSNESPPNLVSQTAGIGAQVTMFSQESLHDFLKSSMEHYPSAKNVVLFLNAHGSPEPIFGGEAIINGDWQNVRHEKMSVKTVAQTIAQVESETGARIGLLDINCCEMGKAENVLELGPTADLILASPQNEFVPKGHEATAAFQDVVGACQELLQRPHTSPAELGKFIIDETTRKTTFVESGRTENPIPTLDLYSTKQLSTVRADLEKAGTRLSQMLDNPEQKTQILKALEQAFKFRQNDFDLRGFLSAVPDPAAQSLADSLDKMTVHSFAGQFRERDYRQSGPIGVFLPELPGDEAPLVSIPTRAGDPAPLVGELRSEPDPQQPRRWAMKESNRLNDLFEALKTSYPAMLEVTPHQAFQATLNQVQPDRLLEIDQQLTGLIPTLKTGSQESMNSLKGISEQVKQELSGFHTALPELQLGDWLARFDAQNGEQQMQQRARDKALEKIRGESLKPLATYQQLEQLPASWNQFVEELSNVIVDDLWADKLKPPNTP